MTKKMIILNASPRKNRNTATLLKEVQRGAEAAGSEVEYIDLVSLTFKGCMSCMACKRTGNKCGGLCAFKDELRPVLEKILAADAFVMGSPIYWKPYGHVPQRHRAFAVPDFMLQREREALRTQ